MAEKLTGEALKDRAAELEIEGRSDMKADELRAAIAAKEAELEAAEGDDEPDEDEGAAEGEPETVEVDEGALHADAESDEGGAAAVTVEGPEGEYAGPASTQGAPSLEAQEEARDADAALHSNLAAGRISEEHDPSAPERVPESESGANADYQEQSRQALIEEGELDEEEEVETAEEAPSATWDFQLQSAQALVEAGELDEEDAIALGALPTELDEDEYATEDDFRPADWQGDSLRALKAAGKLPEGVSDADVQAVEQGRVGEHTENVVLESAREGEYEEAKEAAQEAAEDADSGEEAADAVKEEYESRGMTEAEAQDAQRRGMETLTNPRTEEQQKLLKQEIEMGEGSETTEEGLRKPENVFETREEKEDAEVELEHAADEGHEVPRDPAGDEGVEEASERLSEEEGGSEDE